MYSYYNDYGNYGDYGPVIDALDILSALPGLIEKIGVIFMLATIAIGIVQCFWGYKLYRITIAISGFITGSTIGGALGLFMVIGMDADSINGAITVVVMSMLVAGIIGAVIAYSFELIGVFLVGFSGVYVVTLILSLVSKVMTNNDNIASSFFTAAIPAVIVGILVVKFWKPIVIIYTGLSGALCIAIGTGIGLVAFILCSIGGIWYQIKSNNGLTENKRTESMTAHGSNYVSAPNPDHNPNLVSKTEYAPLQPSVTRKENPYPDIID